MRLSARFTLRTLVRSDTARTRGIENTPPLRAGEKPHASRTEAGRRPGPAPPSFGDIERFSLARAECRDRRKPNIPSHVGLGGGLHLPEVRPAIPGLSADRRVQDPV